MPVIVPTKISSKGRVTVNTTTLAGTGDSFVYVDGRSKYLFLRNPTAGALTPVIDGDGATAEYLPGVGDVTTTAGFSVGSIAAGASAVIDLYSIRSFLKGNIAVTGGTGLVAVLAEE